MVFFDSFGSGFGCGFMVYSISSIRFYCFLFCFCFVLFYCSLPHPAKTQKLKCYLLYGIIFYTVKFVILDANFYLFVDEVRGDKVLVIFSL